MIILIVVGFGQSNKIVFIVVGFGQSLLNESFENAQLKFIAKIVRAINLTPEWRSYKYTVYILFGTIAQCF
jgi:hypothetical protein